MDHLPDHGLDERARHSAGTHPDLHAADERPQLATDVLVRPGIRAVPLTMHSSFLPYSLCYLIADAHGGVHVLDPGADMPGNLERIAAALGADGYSWGDVRSILVTHLHSDHMEIAQAVRERTGAPILMLAEEQRAVDRFCADVEENALGRSATAQQLERWCVPEASANGIMAALRVLVVRNRVQADRLLADRELLDVPGRRLRVILSPGHTPGHMCILEEDDRFVFTGDHVLPNVTPGLGIGGPSPGNPVVDCLASFATIAELDDCEALPGHGYPFRGLRHRVEVLGEKHERRGVEIAAASLEGDSVWEIASRIRWAGGWERLSGFLLYSALVQTRHHLDRLGIGLDRR